MLEGLLVLTVVNLALFLFNIYLRKRDLHTFHNFKGIIGKDEFKTYILIYGKVDLNCQLNEATMKVLHDKITCDDANVLYSFDTLLIPLMIHHNLLNYIKNSTSKKLSSQKNKL